MGPQISHIHEIEGASWAGQRSTTNRAEGLSLGGRKSLELVLGWSHSDVSVCFKVHTRKMANSDFMSCIFYCNFLNMSFLNARDNGLFSHV